LLWVVVSLLFKVYIAKFTDYNATYGAVGGVIVLLLWFYVSSLAILVGAELNAEIEHASPYGKAPGQKNAQGKLLLGRRAERAFHDQSPKPPATPTPASPTIHDRKPSPVLGALVVGGILLKRLRHRKRGRRDTHPLTPASGSREG
jgi:membrane protein